MFRSNTLLWVCSTCPMKSNVCLTFLFVNIVDVSITYITNSITFSSISNNANNIFLFLHVSNTIKQLSCIPHLCDPCWTAWTPLMFAYMCFSQVFSKHTFTIYNINTKPAISPWRREPPWPPCQNVQITKVNTYQYQYLTIVESIWTIRTPIQLKMAQLTNIIINKHLYICNKWGQLKQMKYFSSNLQKQMKYIL